MYSDVTEKDVAFVLLQDREHVGRIYDIVKQVGS
jgi:hypothetical protein